MYISDSQLWVTLSARGHLAVSGDSFGCHTWGGEVRATGI